jgi:hypothetical protein
MFLLNLSGKRLVVPAVAVREGYLGESAFGPPYALGSPGILKIT